MENPLYVQNAKIRIGTLQRKMINNKKKLKVMSLFAGCGGMDLGFIMAKHPELGYEIAWANDFDKTACETYKKNFNHDIVCGDVWNIDLEKVPNVDVIIGGFPCQDFSILRGDTRVGFKSKRGLLYTRFVEAVSKKLPLFFVAENVKGLLTANNGWAIKKIKQDFEKVDHVGYDVKYKVINFADYGVPQNRERVIIVGTAKNKLPPFEHPDPILNKKNWINLKHAIGDLEKLKEGETANHYWSKAKKNKGQGNSIVSANRPGPTMRTEHHGNIEYHWNEKRRLSAREAARIQSFPDDFVFYPSTSSAYKQIGNAVPPVLGWHVATAVQNFLDKHLN